MASLEDLSLGQVAGIIAAGIFIVNILFKLIWPLILVALMNMNESATTWTKVGAHIQGSLWPTLLRADSTASNGVRMSIRFTSKMGVLSTLLLSLASIITPLGLYESIAANSGLENVEFAYAKDGSVFGVGTLPRPAEGHSRVCGGFGGPVACPYSGSTIESSRNATGITISDDDVINVTLDPEYMAYLQSGATSIGPMVSSVFDIDYRTYTYTTDVQLATKNGGKKYVVGDFSQFDTLFLEEGYRVIEGLVVDTKLGSIGFRNHSIPASASKWGTEWTEDLLFIEPQTMCAYTNLTFEWSVPVDGLSTDAENLVLVDHGGFANMNTTFPELEIVTAQDDPQLAYRAYRSAWFQNAYTALYYNITNPGPSISGMKSFSYMDSEVDKHFPQTQRNFSAGRSTWLRRKFSVSEFGGYIEDLPSSLSNGSVSNSSSSFTLNLPDNPWQITSSNFTDAQSVCNGIFPSTRGNISNILGFCGTALGIPQEKGAQNVLRFEPGTSYTQPLLGCASVMRAVIKTVSFRHNGTGLAGLSVTDIREKTYENQESMPLWGVESARMRLDDGLPLWGIIDKAKKDLYTNMTFAEKPDLYLSGYISTSSGGLSPVVTGQNIAGLNFYGDALAFAYATGSNGGNGFFDYSGESGLGVYNRWRNMSSTAEGTARIINLIWTDVAANSVVGTKSWLPEAGALVKRQQASTPQQALVPVQRYTRRVRYHLAYAIPAFIVLAIFAIACTLSFVLAVFGEGTPGRMKVFLIKTSVGRVMTSLLHPDTVTAGAPTKVWSERLGRMYIDFVGSVPRGAMAGQHPAAAHSDIYDPMLVKGGSSIALQEFPRR